MNFMEAVEAMKEGKKVRRSYWYEGAYIYSNKGYIYNEGQEVAEANSWDVCSFQAVDWEVVEEKKPLSDKKTNVSMESDWQYQEKDVKQALKEFIDWISENAILLGNMSQLEFENQQKRIFGKELIT